MTKAKPISRGGGGPTRRAGLALLVSLGLTAACAGRTAQAGLYHYPWCETVRDRCYAKAKVRKAECNWRYNEAKNNQVNGLSRWPTGVSNFCHMYPDTR
jgi:hypothetical protein